MKIAVIAANGRTGKVFVEKALLPGHSVNAGVYHTNNLTENGRLTVMDCDANNAKDLAKLISGQDAVVSFIGHVKGSSADVQTKAMEALVKVMHQQGIRRIVSLTGTGVRYPGDKITLIDRILNIAIGIIDPARVSDGRNHVKVLENSNLDWTVIRVLKLQNTQSGNFELREHGPTKPYVSRQETAEAVLQVLSENTFVRKAPIIGKP